MTHIPAEYDPTKAYAFFTLSILIQGDRLNDLISYCGGPQGAWKKELLEKLQEEIAESEALQKAISPMFDDIADRKRNLFIKDFLLDTPNQRYEAALPGGTMDRHGTPDHLRNVCATIDLMLQEPVHWTTEGVESGVELVPPVSFSDVLCRAFWMVHSNDALSYHLSFEVPFGKHLTGYYGLAMLLKAFDSTEGTGWVLGAGGWTVQQTGHEPNRLLDFIESQFTYHAHELFRKFTPDSTFSKSLTGDMAKRAWQELVLERPDARPGEPIGDRTWQDASNRRIVVLLRDKEIFEAICRVRSHSELLHTVELPTPIEVRAKGKGESNKRLYRWEALTRHFEEQVGRLALQAEAKGLQPITRDELEAVVFLSGFFQNIVDFLEQDDLEVFDGISPLYPTGEDGSRNEGYLIYATPRLVFEVVSTSRSLDRAGRTWLGTCPYLFLVHAMVMHNEGIVRAYERRVSELVDELQQRGIRSGLLGGKQEGTMALGQAFKRIKEFRLVTFEQVHKHLSFNVFRYETEQAFFQRIENVRGTVARQEYWGRVVQHLTETVDALKDDRTSRFTTLLAGFGILLSWSGVLQIWFSIFPAVVDGETRWNLGTKGALVGTLLFIIGIAIWYRRKR